MNDRPSICVSIIMPVYNVERYIRECLDSVVNQTLREIEIICVNDGSKDGSLAILREYAEKDSRIKVIDKANEGQAIARNRALSQVTGEYIVFVDSDDIIDRDLCRKAYELAKSHNSDMVIYDFMKFKDIREISSSTLASATLSELRSSDRKMLLQQMGVVWTKCVRTDFVRSNNIKFPEGRIYEDIFVHWQLVLLAQKPMILPEKLYYYRIQPSATTYRTDWKITDRIFIFDMIRDFLISKNLYEEYRSVVLQSQLNVFRGLHDTIDESHRGRVMELIRNRLTDEHWTYLNSHNALSWKTRDFYRAIRGSSFAKVRRVFWFFARDCYRKGKSVFNSFVIE